MGSQKMGRVSDSARVEKYGPRERIADELKFRIEMDLEHLFTEELELSYKEEDYVPLIREVLTRALQAYS